MFWIIGDITPKGYSKKVAKIEGELEELITAGSSQSTEAAASPESISQKLASGGGGTAMDETIRSLFHQPQPSSGSTKRRQKKRSAAGKASKETRSHQPPAKRSQLLLTPRPTKLINPKVCSRNVDTATGSQGQPSSSLSKGNSTTMSCGSVLTSGGMHIGYTCKNILQM